MADLDQLRRIQQELRAAREFARSVIENVPLPLAVVDLDLRIRLANDAFRALAGAGTDELERRSVTELARAAWNLEEPLRSELEELRAAGNGGKSFAFEHQTNGASPKTFCIRGCALQPDGDVYLLLTVEDITAERQAQRTSQGEREQMAAEAPSPARTLGQEQDDLRELAGRLFTSQDDERRRVARELHDDICQKLAALEIEVQQIEDRTRKGQAKPLAGLERVRSAVGALSEDVRRISHALHETAIDDLGIAAALRGLASEFQERGGMLVAFSAEAIPEHLPAPVATGLYRIAQEALRNVSRHAGTTEVKILLRGEAGGIRLQIADSGKGFEMERRPRGLGLIGMEERARMMEASLSVESKPGEGTTVTVVVPWRAAGARPDGPPECET